MELGGLAALIVFDDADLEIAVEETIRAKFRNVGQACVGANRIYVQQGIYKKFTDRLVEQVKKLKVGDPYSEQTDVSSVLHIASRERVPLQVSDAVGKGARLLLKGKTPAHPQILSDCKPSMLCFKEETFGPLAPIASFKTEEQALELANGSPFGLAGYFFTQNASRGRRVIEALQCGIVGWNDGIPSTAQAPFGGMKHSGFGREGGPTGIYEYLEQQFISHRF